MEASPEGPSFGCGSVLATANRRERWFGSGASAWSWPRSRSLRRTPMRRSRPDHHSQFIDTARASCCSPSCGCRAEREGVSDDTEARKTLGGRLQLSLNEGPERDLFKAYFKTLARRLGDRLPALIPQVYLHYDPEVVSRVFNRDALLRQRMDFLLLLRGHQRIVVEIDGKQHYAEGDLASPRLYAEMVAADREIRLRGYAIYRFGGYELSSNRTPEVAAEFFERLFAAHRIT